MTVHAWENPSRKVDPDVDVRVNGHIRKKEGHHEFVFWLSEDKTYEETRLIYGEKYQKFYVVDSYGLHREPIAVDGSIVCWS
jgi:hypothetical protein